jgi:hypothetical protein
MGKGDRFKRGSRGGLGTAVERKLVINLGKQHDEILEALKARSPSSTYGEIIREMMVTYYGDLINTDIEENPNPQMEAELKLKQLQTANLIGKEYQAKGRTMLGNCPVCPICDAEPPTFDDDIMLWKCFACMWGGVFDGSDAEGYTAKVTYKLKTKVA